MITRYVTHISFKSRPTSNSCRTVLTMLLVLFVCHACKEPFEPNLPFDEKRFLVVEGYVNVGGGITTINLMRSTSLQENDQIIHESNASLTIEDDAGNQFALENTGNGV